MSINVTVTGNENYSSDKCNNELNYFIIILLLFFLQ